MVLWAVSCKAPPRVLPCITLASVNTNITLASVTLPWHYSVTMCQMLLWQLALWQERLGGAHAGISSRATVFPAKSWELEFTLLQTLPQVFDFKPKLRGALEKHQQNCHFMLLAPTGALPGLFLRNIRCNEGICTWEASKKAASSERALINMKWSLITPATHTHCFHISCLQTLSRVQLENMVADDEDEDEKPVDDRGMKIHHPATTNCHHWKLWSQSFATQ